MNPANLDADQTLAVQMASAASTRKKLNAASWTDQSENLLCTWGEKAAGLRWIHTASASRWKGLADKLTLSSIIVTTVASTASLAAADMDDSRLVMYAVGGLGMASALTLSIKKFYNAEEKAADHISAAKGFGSFYRFMTLQLGMSREDRLSSEELSNYSLKEFERLQQDAPGVHPGAVSDYKATFKGARSVPDVAESKFEIAVHRDPESHPALD
jgi:hypothetical protein